MKNFSLIPSHVFRLVWHFSLLLIIGAECQAIAQQNLKFLDLINQGLSRDRYNPRYAPGLFVPSIQFGSGSEYDYESFEQIRLDYYYSKRTKFFLVIPNFDGGQTTAGAEYLLGLSGGKNRIWAGFSLAPKGPTFGPYLRGVRRLGPKSKLHYLTEILVGNERMLLAGTLGFHAYPFASSKNTFIDIKTKLVREQDKFGPDKLNRSLQVFNISAEIGHGWARFAQVKGLELFGAIGIGHSRLNYSTSECIGRSCEFRGDDTELRMLIGMLFQHLPR